MEGDERVRHCSLCKLNVYNLSSMTTEQAHTLIHEREGRLCVRFYQRADGTIITRDCPKGLAAARTRVLKAAVFAACLTLSGFGLAIAKVQPKPEESTRWTDKVIDQGRSVPLLQPIVDKFFPRPTMIMGAIAPTPRHP